MASATRTYGGVTADERRATRRSTLIDAAFDLFAEGGAQAVSKRAVCTRAQLNDRYFYESFTDANALLEAIMREQTELCLVAVSAGVDASLDLHAQIRAVARIALDFLTADPRRGALLLGSRGSEVLQRGRIDSARAIAQAIVAIGNNDGGQAAPSSFDSEVTAYALVNGAMEVIEAWVRGDIATTREHLADLVAGLLAATPAITAELPKT